MLGDELVLGRALRPLKRRVPSTVRTELDEDATAAARADTGIPSVVLRALPERWLRLALVIDSDVSMVLWERHCRELQTALERSGAFRQIEVHQLSYGASPGDLPPKRGEVFLVRPWSGSRRGAVPVSTVSDPSGRTLVMVVTDGAAPAWRDGRMRTVLERWATAGPTAVLHVLPRHLWAGTGVDGDTWHITTPRPGAPNSAWRVADPVLPPDVAPFTGVPVPVVELTPAGRRAGSRAAPGVGRPAPLRLWEPRSAPAGRPTPGPGTLARDFTRSASPSAVRLAAHIAAMAPVTVPVMRLVQSRLPERTGTAALAEIFLSGLLRPVEQRGAAELRHSVRHRFFDLSPEAKDLLLDTVPLAELVTAARRVGEQIEQLVGRSPDFPAWLLSSSRAEGQGDGPEPFARIGTALRDRLGVDDDDLLDDEALDDEDLDDEALDDDEGRHRESETPLATAVVLTARSFESTAVRAHLRDLEELVHPDGTRIERGRLPGTPWHVALAELGEGSWTIALGSRIVERLSPQAVLMVGVAASLKDDVRLRDVVVGTKVYGIRGVKRTLSGLRARPETWAGSPPLAQAARSALREMPGVRAHFAPIAARDVILPDAAAAVARQLRAHYDDAAAIDMEGSSEAYAAYLSAQRDVLVIRGISERADGSRRAADTSGSQLWAAAEAASVALAVLRKHRPRVAASQAKQGPVASSPQDADATAPMGTSPAATSATPETAGTAPAATALVTNLPRRPPLFTGRSAELDRLLRLLTTDSDEGTPLIVSARGGMGGIGKTALALEAAHRADEAGWFPGGSLFLDLRGYGDNPLTADQAVLALLSMLGVRNEDVPPPSAARFNAYRDLLAERRDRMLLILDNASTPSQFLPLLPGTDHHRVLITSRDRPVTLPARIIDLGTLDPDDSVALVVGTLRAADERDERPALEPEALRELAALCGHLPLALQIAAALLRENPHRTVASLVAEIRNDTITSLTLDESMNAGGRMEPDGHSLALRPVLEASYRRLPADQARLLRLLCLAPGPDTGTEAAAALADVTPQAARSLLEELAATRLVTPVHGGEGSPSAPRWQLHDLVAAFGAGVVAGDAGLRREGKAARERLLAFCLRWAEAADDRLRWLPGRPAPEGFADRAQALAWLDEERASLVAAVSWAREEQFAGPAARLAGCLSAYLGWRRYFDDWITVARVAQEAAQLSGDRRSEAAAWSDLGLALREAGRMVQAVDVCSRAVDLHRAIGDRRGEATAWSNLGLALQETGRLDEAIDAHARARDLHQSVGDRHSEAIVWNNFGLALGQAGRVDEAIGATTRARDLHQSVGDRHSEATAWHNLGLALGQAGHAEEAVEAYGRALAIYQEFEDWYGAGRTSESLALTLQSAHRPVEARDAFLRAAAHYARVSASVEEARVRALAERSG
jgi:tetratricopeptide (TPR) repeat protein/nucleoside phosphorylase